MQHDEVIWSCISHKGFCSFKAHVAKQVQVFCRNPDNVTGLCSRQSCPLANSRYATIKEDQGVCYLYMKTIERAHTPNRLWEKIKLPQNYIQALSLIDSHLEFWPKFMLHKVKQRLTKIHQLLIRMRKLKKQPKRTKLVVVNKKQEKQEASRERKALSAAKLEQTIQSELLKRLKEGTYGEIYNYPTKEYENALNEVEEEEEELDEEGNEVEDGEENENEQEIEFVEDDELEEEEEDIEELNMNLDEYEYADGTFSEDGFGSKSGSGLSHSEGESEAESEDTFDSSVVLGKKKRDHANGKNNSDKKINSSKIGNNKNKKARVRVEVEYEDNEEEQDTDKQVEQLLTNQ